MNIEVGKTYKVLRVRDVVYVDPERHDRLVFTLANDLSLFSNNRDVRFESFSEFCKKYEWDVDTTLSVRKAPGLIRIYGVSEAFEWPNINTSTGIALRKKTLTLLQQSYPREKFVEE